MSVNPRVDTWFWGLHEQMVWWGDYYPVRLVFSKKDDGWLFTCVARRLKGGGAWVCHHYGPSQEEAFKQFVYNYTHKPGIKWKPDAYGKVD